MVRVLMVGEKPSIAQSIAQFLSPGGQFETRSAIGTPVHEFGGRFQDKPCLFRVTSVAGHMYSCDFGAEYQDWNSVDPASLLYVHMYVCMLVCMFACMNGCASMYVCMYVCMYVYMYVYLCMCMLCMHV